MKLMANGKIKAETYGKVLVSGKCNIAGNI